jgi:hypothetical protein
MKVYRLCPIVAAGLFLWGVSLQSASVEAPFETPQTYGSAEVSRLIEMDSTCTLLCDIESFPPVVGQAIPVHLEGVEVPVGGAVNREVAAFLQQVLTPETQEPPSIVLKNIRRGITFSLVADVEVDGKDLAQMLVDKGLARRIIRLDAESQAEDSAAAAQGESSQQTESAKQTGFVASRTSKIFHRPDCSHAKRIDPARVVVFQTRQEAEQNGRRPCKTCNP